MYEAKAKVGETTASFSCDDIRQYHWRSQAISYCFRYQTVASNQAVADHELFCLPTNKTVGKDINHSVRFTATSHKILLAASLWVKDFGIA